MEQEVPKYSDILNAKFIGDVVVLVNNDHPPHAVVNGKLVKVDGHGMV